LPLALGGQRRGRRAPESWRARALTLFRGYRTACGVSAATCKITFGLATNAPLDGRSCGKCPARW